MCSVGIKPQEIFVGLYGTAFPCLPSPGGGNALSPPCIYSYILVRFSAVLATEHDFVIPILDYMTSPRSDN